MAKICQITGKKAMVGNNVSHSNAKTKRKFKLLPPNLQIKTDRPLAPVPVFKNGFGVAKRRA